MSKISVGDRVRRDTQEPGYANMIGTVILIDPAFDRARIQWEKNKTWYKLSKLILV